MEVSGVAIFKPTQLSPKTKNRRGSGRRQIVPEKEKSQVGKFANSTCAMHRHPRRIKQPRSPPPPSSPYKSGTAKCEQGEWLENKDKNHCPAPPPALHRMQNATTRNTMGPIQANKQEGASCREGDGEGRRRVREHESKPLTSFRSSSVDTLIPASSKSRRLLLMTSSMILW